jgi:hypothetical protein
MTVVDHENVEALSKQYGALHVQERTHRATVLALDEQITRLQQQRGKAYDAWQKAFADEIAVYKQFQAAIATSKHSVYYVDPTNKKEPLTVGTSAPSPTKLPEPSKADTRVTEPAAPAKLLPSKQELLRDVIAINNEELQLRLQIGVLESQRLERIAAHHAAVTRFLAALDSSEYGSIFVEGGFAIVVHSQASYGIYPLAKLDDVPPAIASPPEPATTE